MWRENIQSLSRIMMASRSVKPKTHKKKKKQPSGKRWSGRVTRESDALTLKKDIFKSDSPSQIAASLKRSAQRSTRRKATPFQSAMSMLTFYINRAGKDLPAKRRRILECAKQALRKQFGKAEKP